MTLREDLLGRALENVREFHTVLPVLTLAETLRALEIEAGTQRRISIINGLIRRAGTLYTNQLKEKHHG